MKNNIILKGMFLLALCVAHVMDAKNTGGQIIPQTGQQPRTGGNVPAGRGRVVRAPTVTQVKLSPAAQALLDETVRYNLDAAKLERRLQAEQTRGIIFTQNDLSAIDEK